MSDPANGQSGGGRSKNSLAFRPGFEETEGANQQFLLCQIFYAVPASRRAFCISGAVREGLSGVWRQGGG